MIEKGKIYKFHVIEVFLSTKNVSMYRIKIDDNTDDNTYATFPLRSQKQDYVPNEVYCEVKEIDINGRYKIVQDEYSLYSSLYQPNETYNFTVESEIGNSKNGRKRYLISCPFKLVHVYTAHNDEDICVGSKLSLAVYLENGLENTVKMHFKKSNLSLEIFEPKLVFEACKHLNDYEKYFTNIFIYKDKSRKLSESLSEMEIKLRNNNRLWLFDYISTLSYLSTTFDKSSLSVIAQINTIIKDLEIWILEESGLLFRFSPEKREETRKKSEQIIKRTDALSEAISLIEDNEQDNYLVTTLIKLRKSLYLRNREHVFLIIYNLVALDKDLIEQNMSTFSELIDFTTHELNDTYVWERIVYILSSIIKNSRKALNTELHYLRNDNTDKETLINLIIGIGTLLNFYAVNELDKRNEYGIKTIQLFPALCKYISYLTTKDKALFIINKSLEWILCKAEFTAIPGKLLRSVEEDPNKLIDYILKINISNDLIIHGLNKKSIYTQYSSGFMAIGKLPSAIKGPNIETLWTNVYSIPGTILRVASFSEASEWDDSDSLLYYKDKWKDILVDSTPESQKEEANEKALIHTKTINHDFTNIVFCTREDSIVKEDGVINYKGYCPNFKVDNLFDIFEEDLHFVSKIQRGDNGKIIFNIKDNLIEYSNYAADLTDSTVFGLCLNYNRYEHKVLFITENGIFCEISLDNQQYIKVGDCYELAIDLLDERSYPIGIIVREIDEKLDKISLLKNQLIGLSEYNIKNNNPENSKFVKSIFPNILLIIDNYFRLFEDRIVRYNLYQIARLIAQKEKSLLCSYYSSCIQYMEMTESFVANVAIDYSIPDFNWDDSLLCNFPSLKNHTEMYNLLKRFGSENDLEYLFKLATSSTVNEQTCKFARLSLAASLIESVSDDERPIAYLRGIVSEEFSDSDSTQNSLPELDLETQTNNTKIEVVNFGIEGQQIEFKTSIVFPAGDYEHKADIESQMFVIMKVLAGFLNAKGGNLYIGVNDYGMPSGINADILTLNCNIDKYERIIRKYIVKEFNKDVNGTIDISFSELQGFTICKIMIPSYIEPLSFREEFYQRQGNETRVINGNDLVMFIRRKLEGKNTIIMEETEKKENIQKNDDNFSTSQLGVVQVNSICDEIFNDTFNSFNLCFFIDGAYMIGNDLSLKDAIISLSIDIKMKDMFILQCYDNGCVNKMPIRNFMNMRMNYRYKNGINIESNLMSVMILPNNAFLIVKSMQIGCEYVKIIPVSEVSAHATLGLKGNQLLSQNYDAIINWYRLLDDQKESVTRLITNTRSNLGWKMESSSFADEVSWLKKQIFSKTNNTIKQAKMSLYSLLKSGEYNVLSEHFSSLIKIGSKISVARKEVQELLTECKSSVEFWKVIEICFSCDISIFRKPISDIINKEDLICHYLPNIKILDEIVKQLFTYDYKYAQSIDFIYPFRKLLSNGAKIFIFNMTKDMSQSDDYEKFIEITELQTDIAVEVLLRENNLASYYTLFELLYKYVKKENNTKSKDFVLSCKSKIPESSISARYIKDFISVFILNVPPKFYKQTALLQLRQNGFDGYVTACMAKTSRDKIKVALEHMNKYIGNIIIGKVVQDYKYHYLLQHSTGILILLQHTWAAKKHYINDMISVNITSVYKEYKVMIGAEIDDSEPLPQTQTLLNVDDKIEIKFSEINNGYVPSVMRTFSKVKVRVVAFPQDFDFKKHYIAIVLKKKNYLVYDVQLIKQIE